MAGRLSEDEIRNQSDQFFAWWQRTEGVSMWDAFNHWERSKGFSTEERAAIWRMVKRDRFAPPLGWESVEPVA